MMFQLPRQLDLVIGHPRRGVDPADHDHHNDDDDEEDDDDEDGGGGDRRIVAVDLVG